MTSKLIAEVRGSTGTLVLNAPERRNALSLDMWRAIPEIIAEFEKNQAIRAIVLKGAGGEAFAAGVAAKAAKASEIPSGSGGPLTLFLGIVEGAASEQ